MKKLAKKLELTSETIRVLQNDALSRVAGGARVEETIETRSTCAKSPSWSCAEPLPYALNAHVA